MGTNERFMKAVEMLEEIRCLLTPFDESANAPNEDREAWREECRKKQAAGVKFERFHYDKWQDEYANGGKFEFSGSKEDYREVPQEDRKPQGAIPQPTIHHIPERALYWSQRAAGTDEVWRYKDFHISDNWIDIPVDKEPGWCRDAQYEPKPKTVKYCFALMNPGRPFAWSARSEDEVLAYARNNGYTIIGNIETREVEL